MAGSVPWRLRLPGIRIAGELLLSRSLLDSIAGSVPCLQRVPGPTIRTAGELLLSRSLLDSMAGSVPCLQSISGPGTGMIGPESSRLRSLSDCMAGSVFWRFRLPGIRIAGESLLSRLLLDSIAGSVPCLQRVSGPGTMSP